MKKILSLIIICFFFYTCAGLPDRVDFLLDNSENSNFSGLQFGLCHAGYLRNSEVKTALDMEYSLLQEETASLEKEYLALDEESGDQDASYFKLNRKYRILDEEYALLKRKYEILSMKYEILDIEYEIQEKEYSLLKELNNSWLRIDFSWNALEKEEGEWDFSKFDEFMDIAETKGMKVLAILDYDTDWLHKEKKCGRQIDKDELPFFLNYIEVVGKRYGSRVGAFEIWNEPNTNRFWTGTDEDFFDLTKQSLALLKAISPDTPVAVGSLFYNPAVGAKSYLRRMIEAGVLAKADAVSLHPYGVFDSLFESRIYDARKLIHSYGYSTPVWITEIGFPTGGSYPNRVKLEKQASIVAKTLTRLTAAGAEMVIWYCLLDSKNPEDVVPGQSSEAFFGIAWPDYTLKPGAIPFSVLAGELQNSVFDPGSIGFSGDGNSRIYQAQYRRGDGTVALILWSINSPVEVALTDNYTPFMQIDLITGERKSIKKNQKILITEDPVVLLIESI